VLTCDVQLCHVLRATRAGRSGARRRFGHLDPDRRVDELGGVDLIQLLAKRVGAAAHGRIVLRRVRERTAERLDTYQILVKRAAPAGKLHLADVTKKTADLPPPLKRGRPEHLLQRRALLRFRNLVIHKTPPLTEHEAWSGGRRRGERFQPPVTCFAYRNVCAAVRVRSRGGGNPAFPDSKRALDRAAHWRRRHRFTQDLRCDS
jgi:hypothetical protein